MDANETKNENKAEQALKAAPAERATVFKASTGKNIEGAYIVDKVTSNKNSDNVEENDPAMNFRSSNVDVHNKTEYFTNVEGADKRREDAKKKFKKIVAKNKRRLGKEGRKERRKLARESRGLKSEVRERRRAELIAKYDDYNVDISPVPVRLYHALYSGWHKFATVVILVLCLVCLACCYMNLK